MAHPLELSIGNGTPSLLRSAVRFELWEAYDGSRREQPCRRQQTRQKHDFGQSQLTTVKTRLSRDLRNGLWVVLSDTADFRY